MMVCGWEKEYKGAVVGLLGYIAGLLLFFSICSSGFQE